MLVDLTSSQPSTSLTWEFLKGVEELSSSLPVKISSITLYGLRDKLPAGWSTAARLIIAAFVPR